MTRLAFALAVVFALPFSANAATSARLASDVLAPLRASVVRREIHLDHVPLANGKMASLTVEPFELWAADARILVHTGSDVRVMARPAVRYFRGTVDGFTDSLVLFAVDAQGVGGLISLGDRRFTIGPAPRETRTPRAVPGEVERLDGPVAYEVREQTPGDEVDASGGSAFTCALDRSRLHTPSLRKVVDSVRSAALTPAPLALTGTQMYALQLVIETDYELFAGLGSDPVKIMSYVANLTAAVATIYNRDIRTNVTIGTLHVYTTADDPWNVMPNSSPNGTTDALIEMGEWYHTHHPFASEPRSAVVLLSAKSPLAGIAWQGILCGDDMLCADGNCDNPGEHLLDGHYAGAYAYCGGIRPGSAGPVADPNGTVNGVLYGVPSSFTTEWPLLEFAHELGHVIGSPHTHCITLDAAETAALSRGYVDLCYAGECYSGPEMAPAEKGTVMSYCHNLYSNGFPQTRFTMGRPDEASRHVADDYLLRAGGAIDGGDNVVSRTEGLALPAIVAPASAGSGATGHVASIGAVAGATYSWSIMNGTITGPATSRSVVFTAGTSGTTSLRVSAYNASGCGLTDSTTISISAASTATPPTAVVAHATSPGSIEVSWSGATGATSYEVWRASSLAAGFDTFVGTSSASPLTDMGVVADHAYLYRVKAVDGSMVASSPSTAFDLATAIVFDDDPLLAGMSLVKAAHVTQLRTAVNALRTLAGLSAFVFTDPVLNSSVIVRELHITQLRNALAPARTALGLPAAALTNELKAGETPIRAIDMVELRDGVK